MINDEAMRRIQHDIDLAEARLKHRRKESSRRISTESEAASALTKCPHGANDRF
jgi:hypothetical protein